MWRTMVVAMAWLALLLPIRAQEQENAQEKAQITISNDRANVVVMRFYYAFRNRVWQLMEHEITAGDEIVYRYPSNIPGCAMLREWGIADGILTVSDNGVAVCQHRLSLCDKVVATVTVGSDQCRWSAPDPTGR